MKCLLRHVYALSWKLSEKELVAKTRKSGKNARSAQHEKLQNPKNICCSSSFSIYCFICQKSRKLISTLYGSFHEKDLFLIFRVGIPEGELFVVGPVLVDQPAVVLNKVVELAVNELLERRHGVLGEDDHDADDAKEGKVGQARLVAEQEGLVSQLG